jgi:RimJ/RimL family protein N-acetyltransferase
VAYLAKSQISRLLVNCDEFVKDWVAVMCGVGVIRDAEAKGLGCLNVDGLLVAGVVYSRFAGNTAFIDAAAAPNAHIPRVVLAAFVDYPFNQLGLQALFSHIREGNHRAVRIVTKIGFQFQSKIPQGYPDGDMLLYTLVRKDCRYLELTHVFRQLSTSNT